MSIVHCKTLLIIENTNLPLNNTNFINVTTHFCRHSESAAGGNFPSEPIHKYGPGSINDVLCRILPEYINFINFVFFVTVELINDGGNCV